MKNAKDLARHLLARAVLRGDPCRILSGQLKGRVLPRSVASQHLSMVLGRYEPAMQRLIAHHVAKSSCVYDVGAHCGFFTLFMAATTPPSATVVAFEPSGPLADEIEAVVRCNGFDDKVRVLRMAVSEVAGKARFNVDGFVGILDKALESRGRDRSSTTVEVTTVSIDSFVHDLGNLAPDFMKSDVESAEPLVLAGAQRVIAKYRPRMLIEVHGPKACSQTVSLCLEQGYRVTHVSTRGETVVTKPDQLAPMFKPRYWTTHVMAVPT